MNLKLIFLLLTFLSGIFQLHAQNQNHIDDNLQSTNYKTGKIITLKDTINCFILDRENNYYFTGSIKYKMNLSDAKTLKIKSRDIMHLEIEGKNSFERLPFGAKSYLMVKLVDGEVKLYETNIDGFDDSGTYTNGGLNATNNPSIDRYFLMRGNLLFKISRTLSRADFRKIFPDDNKIEKEFERMNYQQFIKNIEQLVKNYNDNALQKDNK